jgi:iron complex outermembrane recepter protein
MSNIVTERRSLIRQAVGLTLLIGSIQAARADEEASNPSRTHDLEQVVVTAQALTGPEEAPSQGSLVATEPQSIVSREFIEQNMSPAANYTDIIAFTPSVWSVDPNGPGLMENLATSIRGFQDGQFNVTFDGIPWGDSNDFTHHSTSYFMASNLGAVVVDRGPGNASVLGDATFGGTVAVQSDDPRRERGFRAILSDGSFDTRLGSLRYDTGEISDWGGTIAYLDVQTITSDGYLSNAKLDRSNAFAKVVQPIGDSTTITFASNLNKLQQSPPVGATVAQMSAFGSNFAYNTDPTTQSFYGYNVDKITTDFEFLGLISKLAGWTINNKLYTYAYFHDGWNGEDVYGTAPGGTVVTGEFPNGTLYGPNDVPGQRLTNNYRSVGDIFRLAHDFGPGEAQIGFWYDHQTNYRALIEQDFSDNDAFNPAALGNAPPATAQNSADRIMHDALFTAQGYLQYVWHATSALDVTGGLKEVSFERVLDAEVNQSTLQPLAYNKTWTRDLPSADVHYKIADNWSAYAQWSKGFLAPNLNVLYTTNPAQSTTLNPEGTTNEQIGTTWTSHALTVAADVYNIDFSNLIQHFATGEGVTVFYNEGGVRYRGVETEATYLLGLGFSIYGNASWISAHLTSDDTWVPDTPEKMGTLGLFYKEGPLQGSVIDKYVGVRYGNGGDTIRQGGYSTTEAAVNYTFLQSAWVLKSARLGFAIQNIFGNSSLYFWNGTDNNGDSVWFRVPGRSFQVTLTAGL